MVGPRAVALDRVGLLRDLPLQLHLGHEAGLGQRHQQRAAGRLEHRQVDEAGLGRHPLARERAAAGVAGDVAVGALVVDARRDDPRVLVVEVARLRLGQRHLVPRVALVDRVAERVVGDEGLLGAPVVEVRRAEQDPDRQVDLHQVGGDQLAADRDAGRDVAGAAPLRHVAGSRSGARRGRRTRPSTRGRSPGSRPCRSRASPAGRSRTGRRASARCASRSPRSASAARSSPCTSAR